jgi:uncharacterized protein YndB with AHSA1/START domain
LHHVAAARRFVQPCGCMSPDVSREVELPATADEIWQQVTDNDRLGDWLDADVDLDARPGGAGTFRFADGEMRRAMVRDVEPGRRLSFTWWSLTGASVGRTSTVTITIEPGREGCRLRLVESFEARARAGAGAVA